MTAQPHTSPIPQWTQGDRMRKALHHAGLSSNQMAEYLDVERSTVSTWINDRIPPSTQTMRLWAMRTGVPLEWLRTGLYVEDPGLPHLDSNQKPADYQTLSTGPDPVSASGRGQVTERHLKVAS